jgi:hypothetical protein
MVFTKPTGSDLFDQFFQNITKLIFFRKKEANLNWKLNLTVIQKVLPNNFLGNNSHKTKTLFFRILCYKFRINHKK